jgi:hypothetical protein
VRRSDGPLLRGLAAIALAAGCGGRSWLEEGEARPTPPEAQEPADQETGGYDAATTVEPPESSALVTTPMGLPPALLQDAGCCADILTDEPSDKATAACWTCAKKSCSSEITSCAADRTCTFAVAAALTCTDTGKGSALACFMSAFNSAGDSTETSTSQCLARVYDSCECAALGAPVSAGTGSTQTPPSTCTAGGASVGTSGGYDCEDTWAETCGGIDYEVSCSCPQGSCVCFGPTTHVVNYSGCPFCPDAPSSGSTSVADVFALCGFPRYPDQN